jgi:peroxiredoxin
MPAAMGGNLTGRQAPDLTFGGGLGGIRSGEALSSHRGRVVLLTFWLRDCPICRRHLPQVQALHDRYEGFGLDVITIVHQYPPDQVQPVWRQFGWTFPVACDLDGAMARAWAVGRRPEDYLVGPDGRVVASMRVTTQDVETALAAWRVERCGPWAPGSEALQRLIAEGRYAELLRTAGLEAGLQARALDEGRRDLQARVARIRRWMARRADVRQEVGYLKTAYVGTPLADEAAAAVSALFPQAPR